MKTRYLTIIILMALFSLTAFNYMKDILAELGIDARIAQMSILSNLTMSAGNVEEDNSYYFSLPRPRMLAAVVKGDKVGAAEALCDYFRSYCSSEEFSAAYHEKRDAARPTSEPPRIDPRSIESSKEGIVVLEQQIEEMTKNDYDKSTIEVMKIQLIELKRLVAEWEDPTPNKTKWERNFPEDPALLVKRRLEEYLALVNTVDFSAQLTAPDAYRIQKFTDPDYEKKRPEWKAVYRAGKEVNEAVTAYVRNWLKGEIISAQKIKMPASTTIPMASTDNTNNLPEASTQPMSDSIARATQPKKGLMAKLKDKAKAIIKN